MELAKLTLKQASELLKEKKISAVELTEAVLGEIDQKEKDIHAYITLTGDLALKQAEESDERRKKGRAKSPIDGIPLAIKDNILVRGLPCTAGSKILENFIAPYDATVSKKIKDGGAIILGKTNLDEFAMGSSTETSYFGATKNPHDPKRVPGGSSGGSAAAVASNMALAALGSDTGGSIRQPASFCGVVGLKPTYGAVSRYGLMAMASSLDQIGPITKTVEDARILLSIIEGWDRNDSTSQENPKSKTQNPNKIQNPKLKIGILDTEPTDESEKIYNLAIDKIQKKFPNTQKTSILADVLDMALAVYYIIMPAEVSSNLARYDGVKFGFRARSRNLLEQYLKTRAQGFGPEAKRRIMLGAYVLSAGYYEAYYHSAQIARAKIKQEFEKIFEDFDVLILPTSPILPFKIGEKINEPLAMYLSDIYTVPINIAGLPAISVPIGRVDNLPVGLQIVGPKWSEERILAAAGEIEEIIRGKQ
ncbi:Asp-tRNA(Asn)/Glu-tRNA(Gln) amidotransferase subunit GatA [Candidatus Berkelbacteria bacterium]|nr:Asp-tRNA(Asn)/Glu-tRNA(Gln) amidotransferase subunit GatA [Candidatus Berkelbacteria bacterium]